MPRMRKFLSLTLALSLTGCSLPGGVVYDPNQGLIVDKNASSNPVPSSDGEQGGITLGQLFGAGSGVEGFGYTVGDEPYAVKAGANILSQGGSAADAATAMYFTMAVTYPGAAGLGGGGLCIAFDRKSRNVEAIDFLARNAAGGGAYGVPGNVRGFAQLQAKFGALPFARDIAYGEALAATGFPISEALEKRLVAAQNVIRLDAGLSKEFLDESGAVKPEGATITAPDLGATLAALRGQGPNALYRGEIASEMVKYANGQGGALSLNDFAAYRAHSRAPQLVTLDTRRLYLPPENVGAGSFASAVLGQLRGADGQPVTGDAARAAEMATQRALARFGVPALPADLGSTGFAALDKNGQAVACAVTMNGPFGSGHTVPGTGVSLARTPSAPTVGLASAFLMPAILARNVTGPIRLPDEDPAFGVMLAGAGAGGPQGMAAIATSVVRLVRGQDVLGSAELRRGPAAYDTVNAIACDNGACTVLTDPHTSGFGVVAQAASGG